MIYEKPVFLKSLLIIILAFLILSCPNEEMRELVEIKVSDPKADSFTITSGPGPINTTNVTLYSTVSKEKDRLEMRFKNEVGPWSEWESYASEKSWVLPDGDGIKTVYSEYRDEGHHVVSMSASIELKTTAPPDPAAPDLADSDDSGTSNTDNITNQTSNLTISGNSEANSEVTIYNGTAPLITVNSDSSGYFSGDITLNGDGEKNIRVRATDAAGNVSDFSPSLLITIDTNAPSPPSVPDLADSDDSGTSDTDNITNKTSGLTFSGTAEAGSTVTIYDNITNKGETTASGGNYSRDISLTEGSRSIRARASDAAGNTSGYSSILPVTIDTTPPVINNFMINNGNQYSCSPYGRVTSSTSEPDIRMRLTGTSTTPLIPYASSYNIQNGGTVTGEFYDAAGNVSTESDTITMRTSSVIDRRYEDQTLPSNIAEAAYDLGAMADYEADGGDYAYGSLTDNLAGKAKLWDEDWYKITLDIGYDPRIELELPMGTTNTAVEVFYDENQSQIPNNVTSSESTSGGFKTLTIEFDWDNGYDGEKTLWIRVFKDNNSYEDLEYDLSWGVSIL